MGLHFIRCRPDDDDYREPLEWERKNESRRPRRCAFARILCDDIIIDVLCMTASATRHDQKPSFALDSTTCDDEVRSCLLNPAEAPG